MVGSAIKKYAKEKGLKVSNGVAYGLIGGYMVTLVDGFDLKKVSFSCAVTEESAQRLTSALSDKNFKKQYRVGEIEVLGESVSVTFIDTIGTMKKISACMEVLPNILRECGAIGDGFCTACGNYIDDGETHNIALINGVVHRIHNGCAGSVMQRSEIEQDIYKNEEKHLGKGILGAILGSMVGSIVWAVAYYMGWFFALIGLLIGICAKKGYELLGGKNCKAKIIVILITTVFGAIFGQVLGDFAGIAISGAEYGYTLLDVPGLYIYLLMEDAEVLSGTISNLLLGTVFAILGAVSVMKKAGKEHSTATLNSTIIE